MCIITVFSVPGASYSGKKQLRRRLPLPRHVSFRPLDFDDAEGEDEEEQLGTQILAVMEQQEEEADVVTKIFCACHNSRVGHFGARRTFNLANKHFPGHGIPIRVFMELVAACAICHKYRLDMLDNLKPVVRHLKPPHHRSVIGCDTQEISPRDKFGNFYVDIIVNHSTNWPNYMQNRRKQQFQPLHHCFYSCALTVYLMWL